MRAEVLTAQQLAAELRVYHKTINWWVIKGYGIPHFRTPGGHLRFRRSELAWLLPAPGDELLTDVMAADVLGVAASTVRSYRKSGSLKGVRMPSGHWRYTRSSVAEAYEQAQR